MRDIVLLTDYKGHFGSRYDAQPYRSGMDKKLLKYYFKKNNFNPLFTSFSDVNINDSNWENTYVLYSSQEDKGHHYKSYIEDIILALELAGARVIPSFKYLRAHENKVFMELFRKSIKSNSLGEFRTFHFGTIEELKSYADRTPFPVVIKGSAGAMSKNVALARTKKELLKIVKTISKTCYFFHDLKEIGRKIKYPGYIKESRNREKFILQEFIPGLDNDWKVLVFGSRIYVLYRGVKKNDFRASGSKVFKFNEDNLIPNGLLDYAQMFFSKLEAPNISLDIVKRDNHFYVVEFQAIYFGTSTHLKSNGYFLKEKGKWKKKLELLDLEKVYVDSIVEYIKKKYDQ